MSTNEGDTYALANNRNYRIHVLHADLRSCEIICTTLRIEGYEVAFSVDHASFVASFERRPADVVVLHTGSLQLLQRVRSARRGTAVIALQDEIDLDGAVQALRAGAIDVLARPIDGERLIKAIKDALALESPAISRMKRPRSLGFGKLTEREREVLDLVVEGQSNKEVGRLLKISPRTVEVHRARIMQKTGARNTADLVRLTLS